MKERFSITMDTKIVSKIDKIRGLIPRATYINERMKEIVMSDSRPKHADTTAQHPGVIEGDGDE
jgi:hypothetical protein